MELSEEEWNQTMNTNLRGSWLVSKYVCIQMRDANQGGSIINISSIAGLNRGQLPGGAAYASSKAGLNTLTKVMAFVRQLMCEYYASSTKVLLCFPPADLSNIVFALMNQFCCVVIFTMRFFFVFLKRVDC